MSHFMKTFTMSSRIFSFIAKIRNFFGFLNPRENSLKRRNEDCPEDSSCTKYRKVTSELPNVDLSCDMEKDEGNSAFRQSGCRRRLFNPNIPTSAELELSDNMENMPQIVTQAPNSFNSSGTLKSRKSFISQDNTNRRKPKIPIRVKRKSAWLMPAKTSGIPASSCNPDPQPIRMNRKNSIQSIVFHLEQKEGYRNLLAKFVPNVYNTRENNRKHRSTYMLNKTPQPPKEAIDLVKEIIQTVSACEKTDLLKNTPPSSTKELPAVTPINTLKDRFDLIPMMQPNWLSNLRERHEKSIRMRRQKIKEQEENVGQLARETGELERFTEKRLENYIATETVFLENSECEAEE